MKKSKEDYFWEIVKILKEHDSIYHNIGLDDFGGVVLIDYGETEKIEIISKKFVIA